MQGGKHGDGCGRSRRESMSLRASGDEVRGAPGPAAVPPAPPAPPARERAAFLAALAARYLHVPDDTDAAPPGLPAHAASLTPDVASATFYASHALALDESSVCARRLLAACYLMGGAAALFPFAPSSLGDARTPLYSAQSASSRACALSVLHLLQVGSRPTFTDIGSARIYARACQALGRFREAQDALEWTLAQPPDTRDSSDPVPTLPSADVHTGQVYTQLGRMAMKQARYEDAAAHFNKARDADPLNWAAWTGLCDTAMAPPSADAFPDNTPPATECVAEEAKKSDDGCARRPHAREAPLRHQAPLRYQAPSVRPTPAARRPTPAAPTKRAADMHVPATRPRATTPTGPTLQTAKRQRGVPTAAGPALPTDAPVRASVRRVTPRAAALRSGMIRTAAVPPPPPDTAVPPVPSVPAPHARALATSRTKTNQAAAFPGADAREKAGTRADKGVVNGRARTGAGGRPPGGARTPAVAAAAAAPRRTHARAEAAGAAEKDARVGLRTAAATRDACAPAAGMACLNWTHALLRDVGDAYRHVRAFRGAEALARLEHACRGTLQPAATTAALHCLRGRILYDMAEYADAEKQFAAARTREPFLLMHMDIYSLVLFQLQREVALSALAQDLLEMDPRATAAHIAAGNTWSLQQQHDAAYQCFHQATVVSPECAYAYTLAGYEALELNQPARAVRLFRCARRCDKRHWNALAALGQVYLRQGNPALASEAYAEAFLVNGSNAVLLELLGWALELAGDGDGALAVYERAIQMQPHAAMARLKKAQLLLRTVRAHGDAGRADAAARRRAAHAELLRVCALAPSDAQVHLLLARSYMRLGGGRLAVRGAMGASPPDAPAPDDSPPSSPGAAEGARLPQRFQTEIAHHLATAMDLDPRCVREVSAFADGARIGLHPDGAQVAEDESGGGYGGELGGGGAYGGGLPTDARYGGESTSFLLGTPALDMPMGAGVFDSASMLDGVPLLDSSGFA
ncbi:anaphase-promoting complex subunit cdc27 [Malassezia sp. CBS 17886]|nr:anaphase-promoting complex subunit cdc27 [Malassezia sp. CBS 17886]